MARKIIISLSVLFLIFGCGGDGTTSKLSFKDLSEGLPGAALWRENLEIVDINMDGLLDIIVPPPRYYLGTPPRVFLNKGGGWIETSCSFPFLLYDYGWVEAGPLENGYPSLFLAGHHSTIFALKWSSPLSWADASSGLPPDFVSKSLDVADINGDGLLDMVSTMDTYVPQRQLTRVFLRTHDEAWQEGSTSGIPGGVFGQKISTGDFNNDGYTDIALIPLNNEISSYVFLGDGGNSWRPVNGLPGGVSDIAVADINGDGFDDILLLVVEEAFSMKKVLIVYGGIALSIIEPGIPAGNYSSVTAGYIDCNSNIDIVLGGSEGVFIYTTKGEGFEKVAFVETPSSPNFIKVRDINRDGAEDIIITISDLNYGGIKVFLNGMVCASTRIKNIHNAKVLKKGTIYKIEYSSLKKENLYLRRNGEYIELIVSLKEHGRSWVIIPGHIESGLYELAAGKDKKTVRIQ